MSAELAGRRVLLTGGSQGIGREMALALAEQGASVIVAARGREAIEKTLGALGDGTHEGLTLDVSDDRRWPATLEQIGAGGELHGLITAAGVMGPIGRLDAVDLDAMREAVAVNVMGTVNALHHCLPLLRAAGGSAVTVSGGGATSPLPRFDAYAISKAAVVRLTENVALAGDVPVNSIAPGFVATRIHEATLEAGPEAAGSDYYERTQRQISEGGFPAREAAELACFLLSKAARGISGKLISAQWDPWRDPSFQDRLRCEPDLATLRRIDGQLFGALSE